MLIFHTADWHLGQTLGEFERKNEHRKFLEWLELQLVEFAADVLLIAGDVFDSPNPSAESQRMFYTFLRKINDKLPDLQVVIIAGNHDSAGRLEAPQVLLETMNSTIRGVVQRTSTGEIDYQHLIVPLYKNGKKYAHCVAVPYLRQGDYPTSESYESGVAEMYKKIYNLLDNSTLPIVAMGHLHASGAALSENDKSERIMIGGLDAVGNSAFPEKIAYVALGHLHRPQRVFGRENVRYSGSPIHMSFAEKNYKHGVVKVDLQPTGATNIEHLEFKSPVDFISIESDDKTELFNQISQLPTGVVDEKSPFLEVKLHLKEPEPLLSHQIDKELEGKAVRLVWKKAIMPKRKLKDEKRTYEEFKQVTPLQIAQDVYRLNYNVEMPEKMETLLKEVVNEIINAEHQ